VQERQFLDFVAARSTSLFRTAYALTGHQQAAEDLMQTALAKTAARWGRVEDPAAYVRRLMYHEQVSWWRRNRVRETELTELNDRATGSDMSHGPLLRITLLQALQRLGARQRAVLVLRYFEDLSEREAAAIMGCAEKTVASQASRALARLREIAPELRELLVPEEVQA
jgi:RNA polymerase sigma-70 factor (sigma-E family)